MSNFSQQVLAWFDDHGRHDLPWQFDPTPYRVWVSEIMLQQTQVATVISYYQRFMQSFATVQVLAQANEDTVLQHWAGLGYYARARNLHYAAKQVVTMGGEFPQNLEGLMALKGVGRSTAGAILALGWQHRGVIMDGNVKRVLSRHFAIAGDSSSTAVQQQLWTLAEQLTPHTRVAAYTQAMMDLGQPYAHEVSPYVYIVLCKRRVRLLLWGHPMPFHKKKQLKNFPPNTLIFKS